MKRVVIPLAWYLLSTLIVTVGAFAQLTQQGSKLVGTGAAGTAHQGNSVAISGDGNTAIVGGNTDGSPDTGAVWVYTRSGGVWTQQGSKLVGTGSVGAAMQGSSVALSADGNTAIVGGKGDSTAAGAVWVFTRSGGVWTQEGSKLVGTGAVGAASQGYSVALSADGNTALVGGYTDDGEAGAAWVFTRSGGVWTQEGSKLVGTGAVGAANQGISVALSADGNTAIVGGEIDDSEVGAAWVYTRSGGVWTQQGSKLVGTGGVGTPYHGHSVSLSGDGNTALVGGYYDDSQTGAAWVFTRSGSVWTQEGSKLVGTGAAGTAQQGSSVSLSDDGNTAIVGGHYDDSQTGAAWVFTRSGGVWTQQGEKLTATDATGFPLQGISVSLSDDGNTAIMGGDADNADAGAAWVFSGPDTTIPAGAIGAYNFNGDLTDEVGSNDGSDFGTVGYGAGGGRTWVSLGTDGGVEFPATLTDSIFSTGIMNISFDFRLGGSDPTILLGTGLLGVNAFWQDAGITLVVQGGELVLTYTDGIDLDTYVWHGIQTGLTAGPWYSLEVMFNLDKRSWRVKFDGVNTRDSIPMVYDTDSLGRAVETHLLTLGGIDGNKLGGFYSGDVDIAALRITGSSTENAEIRSAFQELVDHIDGTAPLTTPGLEDRFDFISAELPDAEYDSIASDLFAFTDAYEAAYPPIYQDGIVHTFEELPPLDRTLQTVQEYVLQTRFTPAHVAGMGGVKFEHAAVIPGLVDSSTARIASTVVEVNGSYAVDIAAELTDQSRVVRPTGTYLAPGDLVTIHAPGGVVGQGLSIVVGAHFRDQDYGYIGQINRFPDISTEFPLDSTTITVGNPMGGGIYLKVPDGTSAGWFNLTIENAIMSPYFSWRAGRETDVNDWLLQVAGTGAPWADFESDKFMFTIPVVKLAGVIHPDSIMMRWDAIMDAISDVGGRPRQRPRAEYYSFDTRLVTPAYGAGYPLVLDLPELDYPDAGWNPLDALTIPPHRTLFHEMGHNHLHPTLNYGPGFDPCNDIEAECIVHTLRMSVLYNVYGYSTDSAFSHSRDNFTFEESAFDWIVTWNFRHNLPMTFDSTAPMADKDMLKYQHRGWAKYGDIARWFGWDVLEATNASFYHAGVPQSDTACPARPFIVGRDEYIAAASEAAGVNMAPFFHFWGIQPSEALAETLAANYPPSQTVLEMILHYRNTVAPKTFGDYNAYHTAMYSRMGYQQPRYDEYISQFDSTFANQIQAQFDWIIAHYGLSDLIVARQFGVGEKWNIVSVPLKMEDYTRTTLFPDASAGAFSYEGGYVTHDTLTNGVGYWVKFPAGGTIEHVGFERTEDTVDVGEGWNMVGSLSVPLVVTDIGSVPGGIVTSSFYKFDNAYSAADTLQPGRGYWVKTSQAGKLTLSASAPAPGNRIRIRESEEMPPPPPEVADDVSGNLLPLNYELKQNYPNPFNPVTTIGYSLPNTTHVRLSVFNVLGQEVVVLVDETEEAGYQAVTFDAGNLPSGMYTYRITAGIFSEVRKMLLLK